MSNEASGIPAIIAHDDHARGCQGREYSCTCGYDDRVAAALVSQEAEIADLRKALSQANGLIDRLTTAALKNVEG